MAQGGRVPPITQYSSIFSQLAHEHEGKWSLCRPRTSFKPVFLAFHEKLRLKNRKVSGFRRKKVVDSTFLKKCYSSRHVMRDFLRLPSKWAFKDFNGKTIGNQWEIEATFSCRTREKSTPDRPEILSVMKNPLAGLKTSYKPCFSPNMSSQLHLSWEW